MSAELQAADFNALWRHFGRTAFRLETLPMYDVAEEQPEFHRWLADDGRPPHEIDWYRAWLDQIQDLAAQGRTVERVSVLDEPPTDYQRWGLWCAPAHEAAGERIRYLTRAQLDQLRIPDGDWWLFDDRLVEMRFGPGGEPLGGHLVVDPAVVAEHIRWRDLSRQHARPAHAAPAA